jgi:hypothetical protein
VSEVSIFPTEDTVRSELSSVRFRTAPLRAKFGAMSIASCRDIWLDPCVRSLSPETQTYIVGHELCHVAQQRLGLSVHAALPSPSGLLVDPVLEAEAHAAGKSLASDPQAITELRRLIIEAEPECEAWLNDSAYMQPVISCTFEIDLSNVRIAHVKIGERPGNFTGEGAKIETAKGENINHIVAWDLIQKGLRRTFKGMTLRQAADWLNNQNNWWDQTRPRGGGGLTRFHGFNNFRGEGEVFGDLMAVVDDQMNEWILNAYSWKMNLWAGEGKENQAKGRLFAQEKERIKRILTQDLYVNNLQCGHSSELRYEARDASRQRLVPVVCIAHNGSQHQDNSGQQAVKVGELPDGAYMLKTVYPTHKILNLRYHPAGNAGIIPFDFPVQGVGAVAFIKTTASGISLIKVIRVSREFNLKDALAFEGEKKTTIGSGFFSEQTYTSADALRNSFIGHAIDIPPRGHEYWSRQGVDQARVILKDWASRALADNSTNVPRFGDPGSRFG